MLLMNDNTEYGNDVIDKIDDYKKELIDVNKKSVSQQPYRYLAMSLVDSGILIVPTNTKELILCKKVYPIMRLVLFSLNVKKF